MRPPWYGAIRRGYFCSMDLIVYLFFLFIAGLIVGAIARLIVPGRTSMGVFATSVAGICGSLAAGILAWYVITPRTALVGFILAVLCAAVLVYIFGRPGPRTRAW